MSSGSFKISYLQTIHLQIIYKQDHALNILPGLICLKTQPANQQGQR